MESGKLQKLKLVAYSDPEYNNEVADGEFTSLLNPEKYTFQYKIEQNNNQASGTSSNAPKFKKIPPENLELDFLFDRTGVLPDNEATEDGIIDDIDKFKKVVLQYRGEKHKPNYVMITWGSLLFKGVLTEMNIEFKLFKPDGTPLRAVAKAKFKGFVEQNLRVAKENNQSPDLTHYRIVKEGDRLPQMCHDIYGDSKYYLELARINKLTSCRNIAPGTSLFFPPLQKVS